MTHHRKFSFLAGLAFCLLPNLSLAQVQPMVPPPTWATLPPLPNPVITDPGTFTSLYEGAAGQWYASVYPLALEFFTALAFLELAAFGWSLWRTYHGDVGAALLSTANKILVIGVFLSLLLNGQTWAQDIIGMFETIGKNASNMPTLSPSGILAQGFNVFGNLLWQAGKSGFMADLPTAVALLIAAALVFASFLVIAGQFMVTKIQTFLALGLGFFFLSFGGSRWTTPYVENYFRYCVASGVKLMGLYALIGIGWSVSNTWIIQAQQSANFLSGIETAWKIAGGGILYAFICWYGSSQISQILGGSPNLSHSDFVSFMMPLATAGVTAGIAAAGAATAGTGALASGAAAVGAKAASSAGASAAGAAVPQVSAAASGGSSGGMKAMGQMAQAGASAINRMPSGGSHTPPPHFSGFNH